MNGSAFEFNPLVDPRWPAFLRRHPNASIFYSSGWLSALQRTYRYEPVVYTTSPTAKELGNGLAFCRIDSWLTGRRLVSLPFSDHCAPLVDDREHWECLVERIRRDQQQQKWKYIEFRTEMLQSVPANAFQASQKYYLHRLDLQPSIDQLFNNLHKDSTQRKIRRAAREGVTYEEGCSEELLDKFYRLLTLTRHRHQVPVQPREWFANLLPCLGDSVKIRVASRQGRPLASILTLQFDSALVYKYGGSDARHQNLGGMHLCLWHAIEEAKERGLREFDLGRSDFDDVGLITFKNRWGARSSELTYFRQWLDTPRPGVETWQWSKGKRALAVIPDALFGLAGRLLYRHLGLGSLQT